VAAASAVVSGRRHLFDASSWLYLAAVAWTLLGVAPGWHGAGMLIVYLIIIVRAALTFFWRVFNVAGALILMAPSSINSFFFFQ